MSNAAGSFGRNLANLLADTLTKHKASVAPAERVEAVHKAGGVLNELGEHAKPLGSAFAQKLLEYDTLPEELRPMLELMGDPPLDFAGISVQLFVWGILQQVLIQAEAPLLQSLVNEVWKADPSVPLGPGEAARAAAQGLTTPLDLATQAEESGTGRDQFDVLELLAGTTPTITDLIQLVNRGVITEDEFKLGIQETGLRERWRAKVEPLRHQIPPPDEVMNALLEGQIERDEAKRRYAEAGGDPEWFDSSFNTRGQAPTPTEAIEMLRRGIIARKGRGPSSTSFEQAFLEGPWRNKWLPMFEKLEQYYPPPRTVSALVNEGSITVAEAQKYLIQQGLTPELAAAYTKSASSVKLAKPKEIAENQILKLYETKAISEGEALPMLRSLGYLQHEAKFLIELTDMKRVDAFVERAINLTNTEYVNHTIDKGEAEGKLDKLGIPSTQRNELIETWDIERATRIRVLTEAQVLDAAFRGLIDQPNAYHRLRTLGYPDIDARILIAYKLKLAKPSEVKTG